MLRLARAVLPVRGQSRTLCSTSSARGEGSVLRGLGSAFFGSAVAYTAYLSWWQYTRRDEKIRLIAERTRRLDQEAEPLNEVVPGESNAELPPELMYRRIVCTGKFDHDGEILVGPRSAPVGTVSGGPRSGLASDSNASGWDVVTPFECTDGRRVLVNRGWVQRDQTGSVSRPLQAVEVQGVLCGGESGNRCVAVPAITIDLQPHLRRVPRAASPRMSQRRVGTHGSTFPRCLQRPMHRPDWWCTRLTCHVAEGPSLQRVVSARSNGPPRGLFFRSSIFTSCLTRTWCTRYCLPPPHDY